MKQRLVSLTVLFSVLVIMVTAFLYLSGNKTDAQEARAGQILAVNELGQLARAGKLDEMSEKSAILQDSLRFAQAGVPDGLFPALVCAISVMFFILAFGYVYAAILRPFDKMKEFAQQIAQGNFDVPLDYERSNYFGAFTWAFDCMRREITKARACEHEAVENNKTVIATLSHDIKTPIASIRAYAEGLEANMDVTPEKRAKYVSVLMKKCDEVSRLTDDLFVHSLADLDKLKIATEKMEVCGFIERAAMELAAEQEDVHFQRPDFKAYVMADKNRLMQVAENLINNARKYAKSDIDVFIRQADGSVQIHFRDYGEGIPDEDMPFVFGKFSRGRNCGGEQGSGLGLYIVKYIMRQMDGDVALTNHARGLEAVVCLPVAGDAPKE